MSIWEWRVSWGPQRPHSTVQYMGWGYTAALWSPVAPANLEMDTASRCKLYCDALFCTVLYCTVLYCTLLYSEVLYCTVLWCTVLYCIVLYCTLRYCIVLYCDALFCTVLYCTVLWGIVLYCTVMHCSVLYCTVLYSEVLYCIVMYCDALLCTVFWCIVQYCQFKIQNYQYKLHRIFLINKYFLQNMKKKTWMKTSMTSSHKTHITCNCTHMTAEMTETWNWS